LLLSLNKTLKSAHDTFNDARNGVAEKPAKSNRFAIAALQLERFTLLQWISKTQQSNLYYRLAYRRHSFAITGRNHK